MNGYVLIKVIEYLLVIADSIPQEVGDAFLTQVEAICSHFGPSSLDFAHVRLVPSIHSRRPPSPSTRCSHRRWLPACPAVLSFSPSHVASSPLLAASASASSSTSASISTLASISTSEHPEGLQRRRSLSVDIVVKKTTALQPDGMKTITVDIRDDAKA